MDKKTAFFWDKSDSFFSDKQLRKGSQQQAIDYCKKENYFLYRKHEQLDKYYEFGVPKSSLSLYNTKDSEIPKDPNKATYSNQSSLKR